MLSKKLDSSQKELSKFKYFYTIFGAFKQRKERSMNRILVVVDMQKDFVTGCLGSEEAKSILPAVVEKVQEFEGEVVFTRDTHREDYLNTQEGKNLPVKHCVQGTDGWELMPELEKLRVKRNAVVFDKSTFGSTALGAWMVKRHAEKPIDQIVLLGVCTDICVISNALLLKAYLPEVPVAVDGACCAGVTPESHKRALLAMKSCQVEIL
jgi:nicotinamidase-related amidase